MMRPRLVLSVLAAIAVPSALLACSGIDAEDTDAAPSAIEMENGRETNGRETNGRETNGRETNGRETNGRSAGVWYARRAGAKILDPLRIGPRRPIARTFGGLALNPAADTAIAAPSVLVTSAVGVDDTAITGTLSDLQTIRLVHGQLIAVRTNGVQVGGTNFKNIYLVGRGPTPPPAPLPILVETTTGPFATIVEATPVLTPRQAIRKFVTKRLAETNLPERNVELRVVGASPASPPNAFHNHMANARWHYKVEVKEESGEWRPFCANNADGSERLAIAIPDKFNYVQGLDRTVTVRDHRNGTTTTRRDRGGALIEDDSVFTFACDNAAVSKCVEKLKYDPESSIGEVHPEAPAFARGRPAQGLLESCVRMFRADFCGNGISMTLDGTELDIFDSSQINTRSIPLPTTPQPAGTEPVWAMEASWRPEGAKCGQRERQACIPTEGSRWASFSVKTYIEEICPTALVAVSASEDGWCGASHYVPGVSGPSIPWNGTGGGGGGTHPVSLGGSVHPQDINGTPTPTGWDEENVIWTVSKENRDACKNSIPLAQITNGQVALP